MGVYDKYRNPEKRKLYMKEYQKTYAEKHRSASSKSRLKLIMEGIKAMGSQCACCGETNSLFLTLDHVQNDGYKEPPQTHMRWLNAKRSNWDSTRYQLLCFNCNCGRARNGGICPHLVTESNHSVRRKELNAGSLRSN